MAVAGVAVLACTAAWAAHPLVTEDTGTQGTGKFELELGSALAHDAGARIVELDPQLSYGVTPELDVIVRPTLFRLWDGTADRINGFATLSGLLMTYMAARFGVLGVYVTGRSREKCAAKGQLPGGVLGDIVKAVTKKK